MHVVVVGKGGAKLSSGAQSREIWPKSRVCAVDWALGRGATSLVPRRWGTALLVDEGQPLVPVLAGAASAPQRASHAGASNASHSVIPKTVQFGGVGSDQQMWGEGGGGGLHLPPLHPHSPGQQRFNRSFGGKRQLWTRAYTGGGGGTPLQTKVTIPRPLLYPLPTATRTPATQCPPGQTKWRGRGRNWTGGKGRTKEGNRTGQTALAENGAERRRRTRKGKTGKNHCGC